jgi:RHS repeat-associated protein
MQVEYSYDPYGNMTISGSTANSYAYTGREFDGLGVDYYRARYYNPQYGRFLSEDPMGLAAGPNLYQYANGSPTNFRDPNGRFVEGCLTGIGGYEFGQFLRGMSGRKLDGGWNWAGNAAKACAIGFFTEGIGEWLQDLAEMGEALEGMEGAGGGLGGLGSGELGGSTASLADVNAVGGEVNCVNCAIATANTLAGCPTCAMDTFAPDGGGESLTVLEETFGGQFQEISGPMEAGSILSEAGDGSQGIVAGWEPGQMGHVWNAIIEDGTITFVDGQSNGSGLGNFGNYSCFAFLLICPGSL